MNILLLGGTTEGRSLACRLARTSSHVTVSVATPYGRDLLTESLPVDSSNVNVRQGRLDSNTFGNLLQSESVDLVIDATHPFAEIISNLAVEACESENCELVRLERPIATRPDRDEREKVQHPEHAARRLSSTTDRILLTTGTRNLHLYTEAISDRNLLHVRILPFESSIETCLDEGISRNQIIAMQGPFSVGMNRETFRQFRIHTLVTKESGRGSGLKEKLKAAAQEELRTILIKRPALPPVNRQFEEVDTLMDWLRNR